MAKPLLQTFNVDVAAFQDFITQLAAADAAIPGEFQKAMKNNGQVIMYAATTRLAWSHKIPRTLRSQASATKVTVHAGNRSVLEARWWELGRTNKNARWHHPVWPGKKPRRDWAWVSQNRGMTSRPYLRPALMDVKDDLIKDLTNRLVNTVTDIVQAASANDLEKIGLDTGAGD